MDKLTNQEKENVIALVRWKMRDMRLLALKRGYDYWAYTANSDSWKAIAEKLAVLWQEENVQP